MAANADRSPKNVSLQAMHLTHALLKDRIGLFNSPLAPNLRAGYLEPSVFDLMTGQAGCGSGTKVLARILLNFDYPVRIGQMKANGYFAAHNIVEVRIDDRWVVLDPLYNLAFFRPDSSLADFATLHRDWAYYKAQVPPGYDSNYRYEDVRYTNWSAVPVILPLLRRLLNYGLGERRTANICLRVHLLRIYNLFFYITLCCFILLNTYLWRPRYGTMILKPLLRAFGAAAETTTGNSAPS